MKHSLTLFALAAVIGGLVACSKNDSNGGGGDAYNPVAQCPPGTAPYPTGCTPYSGILNNVNGPLSYMADRNGSTNTYNVSSGYRDFLKKVMQTCDLASWTAGQADCSAWIGGNSYHSLVIHFDGASANQVGVAFRSCPSGTVPVGAQGCQTDPRYQGGQFNFSGGFYRPGATLNPLTMNMFIAPFNNNNGFAIYANGASNNSGWNKVIYIEISNGHFGDPYFDFRVLLRDNPNQVGGTVVSSGRLIRCDIPRCGT